MRRSVRLSILFIAVQYFAQVAQAQAPANVRRIGVLSSGRANTMGERVRKGLHELGYVDGENIVIITRGAQGKHDRLPALAEELVRLRVDVLFASSFTAAKAAKSVTSTIPIVFLSSPDPVAAGLVDSLAHPGGKLTGATYSSTVLAGKRLQLLKETIPKPSRVAVLWHPGNPGSERIWEESRLAARGLGLQLHSMAAKNAEEFEFAFQGAIKTGSRALSVTLSQLFHDHRGQIAQLAVRHRLPAIYADSRFVREGGLMSYATDREEQYRRAVLYVDKILRGAKPGDLPVERPAKFELVVNMKAARQIGLEIPSSVLYRAKEVIR